MSLMPTTYDRPHGVPLYWMDEQSGVLRAAVLAYVDGGAPTAEQMELLRDYMVHFINAPCWVGVDLSSLRARAPQISTPPELTAWLLDASGCGLDPL